ncbi:MAG: response regulator transcription factor, partial [Bdellovibrionales bacterium]|nr:response regulator transcription factor [Bdellovibrionales bacterium]
IMDLCMPKLDGIEAMKRIKTGQKDIPVLILSANEAERNIRAALKAGAKGFLPKNAAIDELEFALKSIISGKTYLSPSITESIMSASGSSEEENLVKKLTDRELEILKLIAEGISNKQIGKMLHISSRTVDTHRSNILKKLEVKSNQELVKIAISHNLIDL